MEKDINYDKYVKLEKEFRAKEKSMEERIWIDSSVGRFDDVLRTNYNKSIDEFGKVTIEYLAQLTNAFQGVLYIIHQKRKVIEATACFACKIEKLPQKEFEFGEGLIGQAASSKTNIIFDNLPPNTNQNPSMGVTMSPKEIVIMPLLFNKSVYGVLELVYINDLEEKFKLFLDRAGQNIGAMLESILNNLKTQQLLQDSQEQAETLRAQEEELRQNMEELTSTQEEMERKKKVLEMSEAKNKLFFDNAYFGILGVDDKGRITDVNKAGISIFDDTLSALKEKEIDTLIKGIRFSNFERSLGNKKRIKILKTNKKAEVIVNKAQVDNLNVYVLYLNGDISKELRKEAELTNTIMNMQSQKVQYENQIEELHKKSESSEKTIAALSEEIIQVCPVPALLFQKDGTVKRINSLAKQFFRIENEGINVQSLFHDFSFEALVENGSSSMILYSNGNSKNQKVESQFKEVNLGSNSYFIAYIQTNE